MSALIDSINLCDTIESIRILQNNPNINLEEKDEYCRTALHISCQSKLSEISHLLLKNGADILNQGENGNYPLHYAVLGHDLKIIKKIINNHFDPDLPNKMGETALHLAVQEGDYEVVSYLLNKSNIHITDIEGNSVLHKITPDTSFNIFSLLLSNGANIHSVNDNNSNIMHILSQQKTFNLYLDQIMRICLDNKVDCHQKNNDQESPVEIALKNKNIPFLKVLKEYNPFLWEEFFYNTHNILTKRLLNQKEYFSLFLKNELLSDNDKLIFLIHNEDILSLCLENNLFKVNFQDTETGESRLHKAIEKKEKSIINLLISHGANVNLKDFNNNTPLHILINSPDLEIAEILVFNGASLHEMNNDGITPSNVFDINRLIILHEQKELKKSFAKKS